MILAEIEAIFRQIWAEFGGDFVTVLDLQPGRTLLGHRDAPGRARAPGAISPFI